MYLKASVLACAIVGGLFHVPLTAAAPIRIGSEFDVAPTTGSAGYMSVASNGDDGFVVVWDQNYSQSVKARVFDNAGHALGAPFQVNDLPGAALDYGFRVAPITGQGFVVVWDQRPSEAGYGWRVRGRRFASSGTSAGGAFQVDECDPCNDGASSVAEVGNGFVVSWWRNWYYSDTHPAILARQFGNGAPLGGDFLVSSLTENPSYHDAVAANGPDGFVVVWDGYPTYPSSDHIVVTARRYSLAGVPGTPFQVNSSPIPTVERAHPAVSTDGAGGSVIVWDGGAAGVLGQRYDASGTVAGSEFQVGPSGGYPAVSPDGAGGFVVVWRSSSTVRGRLYDGSGMARGPGFTVSSSAGCCEARIAPLGDGRIVIVWPDTVTDTFRAQLFDADPLAETLCGAAGCTVQAAAPGGLADGEMMIDVPPGALTDPITIVVLRIPNGDFELAPGGDAPARVLYAVELLPKGQTFLLPVTVTFSWPDADGDDIVDGTGVKERDLKLWKDGARLTKECGSGTGGCGLVDPTYPDAATVTEACCDRTTNTWTLELTSFSQFALAMGSDIGVKATKLIALDKVEAAGKAKIVFVSKDVAINKGAAIDTATISATVTLAYGAPSSAAGSFVIPAGSSNGTTGWKVNKSTLAKYVNKSAPDGATEAKIAVIKPAKVLKLVGKGLGDDALDIVTAGAPSGGMRVAYEVDNDGEINRHCTVFPTCLYKVIAGGTGAKLVCKNGVPDAGCTAGGAP